MKVKALKLISLYTSSDSVRIPEEIYKTHVKKHTFFAVKKSKK